jgi:hypothetical protein
MSDRQEAKAQPRWTRSDFFVAGALFVCAVVLRIGRLNETVWGDEALYYYLARSWGRDRHWVDVPDNTSAQIANRPLFFILYFPVAQFGLVAVRTCNMLISSATCVAVYGIARLLGASYAVATIAGSFVLLQDDSAAFATRFFPDTTTTFFMVLAVGLCARGRYGFAALCSSAAVLSKEVAVAFSGSLVAAVVMTRLATGPVGETRINGAQWWRAVGLLCIPFPLFIICQFLAIVVFKGRMQGWSSNPINTGYLSAALVGPTFVPFAVTLLLKRRWVEIFPALSLPAFYLLWCTVGGRGVEGWYRVSMVPLAAISVAAAVTEWQVAVPTHWSGRVRSATQAALTLCPAFTAPWIEWLAKDLVPLHEHPPDQLGRVAKLIHSRHPHHLGMVSCFWSYAYFPLRPATTRVTRWYPQLDPQGNQEQPPDALLESDIVVLCAADAASFRAKPASLRKRCTMLSTRDYEVIRDPRTCLAPEISRMEGKAAAPRQRLREYRANDMQLDGCVTLDGDMALLGRDCPPRFVVFGPYLESRDGATVDVSFHVRSEHAAKLSLDLAADLGKQSYGSTTQDLTGGEPSFVHFRLRKPDSARGLEARISLVGTAPVNFQLDEFSLSIAE